MSYFCTSASREWKMLSSEIIPEGGVEEEAEEEEQEQEEQEEADEGEGKKGEEGPTGETGEDEDDDQEEEVEDGQMPVSVAADDAIDTDTTRAWYRQDRYLVHDAIRVSLLMI